MTLIGHCLECDLKWEASEDDWNCPNCLSENIELKEEEISPFKYRKYINGVWI